MFDLRYHVVSLAAVFLMLVIGILVGVGISGRGFVDEAERTLLNDRIAGLSAELDAARERSLDLRRRQAAAEDVIADAYPLLVGERLRGQRVAIVAIGSIDDATDASVRAVEDAGGHVLRIRALTVPLEADRIQAVLARRPALAGYLGADHLDDLARDLARELADGGQTPLWEALSAELVEEREGASATPVDGVVVMRSAEPQGGETARFLAAFYAGLRSTGVPVVGVEASEAQPSALPAFRRQGLSTVDGVDTPPGRLALALLLAGAEPGDYGIDDRAAASDGILPPLEPLPPAPGG